MAERKNVSDAENKSLRAENEALKTENARMREALEDNCKQCSNVESNINSYHCCNSCLTYKALEGGE